MSVQDSRPIQPDLLPGWLKNFGVAGVTTAWVDNNGIPRSRTVPIDRLAEVVRRGVGVTTLFAVFDTHDGITFAHDGLSTPSGDVRLVPVLDRLRRLAGQRAFAWAPGRLLEADGSVWAYDPRAALEAQVKRAADVGLEILAGYEIEFFIGREAEDVQPAHRGPAYSPHALLAIDEFVGQLLRDLAANGLEIGQLHTEYGLAQVELSLAATDPVAAADDQLLARQTIHAAARAHGLRASFAPLVTAAGVGNGWHIHSSVRRGDENLLASSADSTRPGPEGASYVAGLLRDLSAITAITAPSVPSLARLRPGYFASAYAFWGVENREAALRYVPSSPLLGASHANIELKPSDASANPYLALAAIIAAGLAGIEDGLALPDAIAQDPGGWTAEERGSAGIVALPATPEEQEQALLGSAPVRTALGEPLLGAFLAVRRADAAWAAERTLDEIIAAHLWRY
ncbi:MAG TPA: glutamine synthetase family protein [Solirubrobacteraceae bacterium]|nr:glutamine synthetase family protein [Solirubrobacteraceae bacterium]